MVSRRRKCDSSAWVPLFHRSKWKWHSPKFVLTIRRSAVLSDQQLRDASFEQHQDLIARVDLLLRRPTVRTEGQQSRVRVASLARPRL
jgi:hypothetical protein